jgi:tRNA threonylcarbamoyladenosine biosynthesis protein TsaB
MKILGLDSSGLVASVAIVEDNDLKGEYTVNYKKTHSQTLLPMLDEVAKMIELDLNSIDAIAVSGGPDFVSVLPQQRDSDWRLGNR